MERLNKRNIGGLSKVRMVGRNINEIIQIEDALEQADDQGLDLILVSKDVSPPVVRIQDLNKIEYEKKKARKKNASSSSSGTVKEMRFLVNISENDLSIKIAKINKFLKSGNKVKVSVKLKGRERERPQRAFELLEKIRQDDFISVSSIALKKKIIS